MKHYQQFIIHTPEVMANCVSMIAQVPLDGSVTVTISGTKEERRIVQNSLLYMWIADVSKHQGYTVDQIKEGFRKEYLVPIYLAEPQGRLQAAWAASYADISELVFDLLPEEAKPVIDRITKVASTTWASVAQMAQYLTMIERYCMSHTIPLRHPDDYHRAMGAE